MDKYRYSEIFYSIQGEGKYTGHPTVWLRYFMCNLQCSGFGQKDPTNPDTYELPYEQFDVSSVQKIEDLPVWKFGCDSSYSWAAKFKHLQKQNTPQELAALLIDQVRNEYNPQGLFNHPKSGEPVHLCFTGGEPMLFDAQQCTAGILCELDRLNNCPDNVTFETNGTHGFLPELYRELPIKTFMSVSPKLWHTSGEKPEKAIKPDVVASYADLVNNGQLKFVVDGSQETWDELDKVIELYRGSGCWWPIYIMKVGATVESQTGDLGYRTEEEVCLETIKRGYIYTSRVHVNIFGNRLGT